MQVITSSQKNRVLEACHSEFGGGHFGQGKTLKKLEERFERPDYNQFLKSYTH